MFGGWVKKCLLGFISLALVWGIFNPIPVTVAAASCPASLLGANDGSLSLSQLEQKQTCLVDLQNQYKGQASQAQQQANSIQGVIGNLNNSIVATNNQIDNTQEQIATTQALLDNLNSQITQTQTQLDGLTTQLDNAYDSIYELSQTNALEVLLQSQNINDLLSQSQYIESLQTQLQGQITQANALKASLNSQQQSAQQQQANLENLNNQLTSQKASLAGQVNSQGVLLTQTKQQESNAQSQVQQLQSQQEVVSAAIAAIFAASGGGSINSLGYPWASLAWDPPNDWVQACNTGINKTDGCLDSWGFFTRNCTSYAAWYWITQEGGPDFMDGNANNWPSAARSHGGLTVNSTPTPGAIVSWPDPAPYGHVAIVTAVSGSTMTVQQYNATVIPGTHYLAGLGSIQSGVPTGYRSGFGQPSYIHLP